MTCHDDMLLADTRGQAAARLHPPHKAPERAPSACPCVVATVPPRKGECCGCKPPVVNVNVRGCFCRAACEAIRAPI